MPIDPNLLASLEGQSPIETLSKAVEKNPDDFDSWTKLLSKLDDQVRFFCPSLCCRILRLWESTMNSFWVVFLYVMDIGRRWLLSPPIDCIVLRPRNQARKFKETRNDRSSEQHLEPSGRCCSVLRRIHCVHVFTYLGYVDLLYVLRFHLHDSRGSRVLLFSSFHS